MKSEFHNYVNFTLRKQSGFTIVEIMLAITLSLILIAGVIQVYLSSKESFRVQNELARMQESQRIAIEFLQNDIRRAGFQLPNGTKKIVEATTLDGGGATSDQIEITYRSNTDCLGQDTVANNNGIAVNRYFIDEATDRLMCLGNGNAVAQPVADGIESMQILLGENTNFANDSPQLPSAEQYVNINDNDNTTRVVSVRIALLSRTTNPIKKQAIQETFTLLDTEITPANPDRFKRQVITTTIPLRNRSI